jgi:hypothetical protein
VALSTDWVPMGRNTKARCRFGRPLSRSRLLLNGGIQSGLAAKQRSLTHIPGLRDATLAECALISWQSCGFQQANICIDHAHIEAPTLLP